MQHDDSGNRNGADVPGCAGVGAERVGVTGNGMPKAAVTKAVKDAARNATTLAIRKGVLVRQPCETCGEEPTEAHHDDYTKPLEVRWLCHEHHWAHHREHGFASTGTRRKKPGRPRLGNAAHVHVLSVKVSADERRIWSARAALEDVTLGEWIRRRCNSSDASKP